MLICERVIVDADTQQKTLVGIFDNVNCAALPALKQLALYVKLTDAQGAYQFVIDCVHVPTDRKLATFQLGAVIPDRLVSSEMVMQANVAIDQPGLYEFRILANGSYVARATFNAVVPNVQGA